MQQLIFNKAEIYIHLAPWPLQVFIVFVLGLALGSFLNVCAVRWLAGNLSVVAPRSFCPECKHTIRWYDNVPVLSFFLLKGKCRDCGKRISWQYPLVELTYGLLLVFLYGRYHFSPAFLFYSYFVALLLIATATDFREQIIPDEVSFYGIVTGLLMSFVFPELQGETNHRLGIANSVLGMLLGGGVLYLIAIVGDAIYKKESMGGGDIKLLATIGAFLGPNHIFLTIILASCMGAAVGLVLKVVKRAEVIAFGPFLAAGAFISLCWGGPLASWMFPTIF